MRELYLSLPKFQALKKLSSNKDVVIHKSDKGNSVVIVDRQDYIKKLEDLVADPLKFEKVDVKENKDYSFMTKKKGNGGLDSSQPINEKVDQRIPEEMSFT